MPPVPWPPGPRARTERVVRRLAAFALVLLCCAGGLNAAESTRCTRDTVTILAPDGPVRFTVEIAQTAAEKSRGLMFRPRLAPRAGMLFLYDPPQPASFWMKNTMIPLDMLFIDRTGRVVNIVAEAEPYSLRARASDGPVRAVLEINGGLSAHLGIEPGAQVIHPAFRAAPAAHRCPAAE